MANHYVNVVVGFHAPGGADEGAFEGVLDATLEHLEALGRESDLTASLTQMTATFTVEIPDREFDSLMEAATAVRTALHAAGCGTASWSYDVLTIDQSADVVLQLT